MVSVLGGKRRRMMHGIDGIMGCLMRFVFVSLSQ